MGSAKKATRKVVNKVSKQVKRTKAEDVLSLGTNKVFDKIQEETGAKLDFLQYLTLPTAAMELTSELGERFYDKPKAQKEAQAKFQAEVSAEQDRQLKEFRGREAQEAASKAAGEELIKGRRKQERRRSKPGSGGAKGGTLLTGPSGTVATGGSLGGAAGKKTKLGQ